LIFDVLFYYSKEYVRQAAIDRANQLLDNTVVRISGIMNDTEVVTNYMAVVTPQHLHPDSLLAYTRRTVEKYKFLTGFAISMEPYYFPDKGRYYSAYSLRQDDTITTVREGPFEYFEKVWYKSSKTLGVPCWVDAYDDYNEGTLSSKDYLTSYCCPMRDAEGKFVGSITASLTLKWLSEAFAAVHPYPNSSAIMIGSTGVYLVHPDTAKLFRENIFSDAAPEAKDDIQRLGKSMIAGRSGMMKTIVDGNNAYIFYRPLERTGWSIALVCPEDDVFSRYNRLFYIAWTIIGVGLILLLLFCYQTIRKAMQPLKLLASHAEQIAKGSFAEPLPYSERNDSVGRLQNSFIRMERSLLKLVSGVRAVNDEMELKNQDLNRAYQLKIESDRRKSSFILDMAHQIRTPLNVISGFSQVLSLNFHEFSEEELRDITSRMKSSSITIHRIATMLAASSASETCKKLVPSFDEVNCIVISHEVIDSVVLETPSAIPIRFEPSVSADFVIHTDRRLLSVILSELLCNACRFTTQGFVKLSVDRTESKVRFIVTDTGLGIPINKRDSIFTPFTKLDSFSEGVGLGLSYCKFAVDRLRGEIMLDPDYSPGSRFVVSLPI